MSTPSPIERLFGFAEAGHGRALVLLLLACFALFSPGFVTLQPMDRDEPRFAQATKQMLETGDAIDIRFQGEARHKKPVGIYWMQAGVVAAADAAGLSDARTKIWLYRLPSLIGAVLAVLFTYLAAAALTTRRAAVMAGLLMAGTILLGVEARLAKTDAVVAATVTIAMAALARAWMERDLPRREASLGWAAAFWLALGIGALVKGPITLAVVGLAAIALSLAERRADWLRRLRPLAGVLLFALVVAPWFVAITLKSGGAFFVEAVGKDMLAKAASGQESHGAPPGTYLGAFFGTAWPLAPFVLLALPFAWRARRDPAVMLVLAWAIPMWIVFELVPTKLPHYVLPLYPALAILVALAAERGALALNGIWPRVAMALLPLLVILLAVAAGGGLWWLDRTVPWLALAALVVALLATILALAALFGGRAGTAAVQATLASAAVAWGIYGFAIPLAQTVALSPRLMAAAQAAPCRPQALATAGYREPSLVFLGGTSLQMTDGAGAAAFLSGGGCRVAFVEGRLEAAFTAAAAAAGTVPRLVGRVQGINLNGGRRMDIGVYAQQGS
jgi:4-amino-4-deoxy-L-arabinose transferase-like glycosyltransferase